MVWPFDGKQDPPSNIPNLTNFQSLVPPAAAAGGASSGGDGGKNNSNSKMEYSFDSSALERAAAAAKDLENTSELIFMLFKP